MQRHFIAAAVGMAVCLAAVLTVSAQNKKPPEGESERKVAEKDVPKVALDAIKKVANGAALTEFAEEKEHGHTFYEGTFKSAHGKTDVLVTASGDLVEIEEAVTSDSVPQAVRDATKKAGGADAKYEKKTMIIYEAHYKKGDRHHELVLTPDGHENEHEEKSAKEAAEDKE